MKKKIIILHGWAYSIEKWEPFVHLLQKNGFEVDLLKIPGLTAPLDAVWTLHDYEEWLEKELKQEKDVVLLGHSNGGRIAISYTVKNPEKVSHLFLLDSAGMYHNDVSIRLKRVLFGSLAKLKTILPFPSLRAVLYRLAREKDYQEASPLVRKTMKNLINVDLLPTLSSLATPTTIIWGEYDSITPLSDGKLMHEKIPHSTLHIIADAKHSPQFSKPEEVTKIILKVLKS